MCQTLKHVSIAVLSTLVLLAAEQAAADTAAKMSTQQIKTVVERRLSQMPNYHPGDLIAVDTVEPIFDELHEMGLKLDVNSGAEELFDSFLRETDFLVVASHLPEGHRFMHLLHDEPGAYDLMERMSWNPDGRKILHDMVLSANGVDQFKKLLTPEGLKALKKTLAADPNSKNLGLPTGNVHTADDMLKHIDRLLAEKN